MKRKQRWETEKGFIVVGSIVVESVVVGSVVIETIFVGSVVVESVVRGGLEESRTLVPPDISSP